MLANCVAGTMAIRKLNSRRLLMLERVAGFVRGDADSGDRPAMQLSDEDSARLVGL